MKERLKIIGEVLKPFNQYVIGDSVILDDYIYKGLRKHGFVTFGEIHSDTYVKLRFETIDVLKTDQSPVISFALPTYNNSDIIWLQLESLCAQIDAPKWELIISEEESDKYFGVDGIEKFKERLSMANCVSIKYISVTKKIPLSKKWIAIGERMDENSIGMIICASDNYSFPDRIKLTYEKMMEGFDWIHWKCGYFYNILNHSTSLFTSPTDTGLFMAYNREMIERVSKNAKTFPLKGVDGWLKKNMGVCKSFVFDEITDGIHTDGYNTISHGRRLLYGGNIFKGDDADKVFNLFPNEIKERLKSMRNANS